jgi:hypothetical protein
MEVNFVMSARRIVSGKFGSEPASGRYLIAPREANPEPGQRVSVVVPPPKDLL